MFAQDIRVFSFTSRYTILPVCVCVCACDARKKVYISVYIYIFILYFLLTFEKKDDENCTLPAKRGEAEL